MKKTIMMRLFLAALAVSASAETAHGSPNSIQPVLDPLTVSLVFDIAGRGDGGFNDLACAGVERAASEFGVQPVFVEHKRNLELNRALEQAASETDVIIGVGFAFSDRLNRLAALHPDKRFVCVDYAPKTDGEGRIQEPPRNLAGLMFREEEGAFLVGALAALKSRTARIGFIGGMDCPIIRKFQAGFLAGAGAVRPDVRVLSEFAGLTGSAFTDPEKGYEIAMRLYAKEADVIFHASGATGSGVFRAAREMNRLVIGVDIDESGKAPGLVLTSMTKNIDAAVYEAVRSCIQGEFGGGLRSLGLKEKGVGFVISEMNRDLIPRDILERVRSLESEIASGERVVPAVGTANRAVSREGLVEILDRLAEEIVDGLNSLDRDLKEAAESLSGLHLRSDAARRTLKGFYSRHPTVIDCGTAGERGILLAIEPQAHQASEGEDISGQAHMIRLLGTRRPVMSGVFRSVEGPEAAVIHQPVFSKNGVFTGSVFALFAPEYILAGVIGPVVSNLPVEVFLMQTDGRMVYSRDASETGLNLLTDETEQFSSGRSELARKLSAAETGDATFLSSRGAGEDSRSLRAVWRTISLHGAEWRLVVTAAEGATED